MRLLKILQNGNALRNGVAIDEECGHPAHGVPLLVFLAVLLVFQEMHRLVLIVNALPLESNADSP